MRNKRGRILLKAFKKRLNHRKEGNDESVKGNNGKRKKEGK